MCNIRHLVAGPPPALKTVTEGPEISFISMRRVILIDVEATKGISISVFWVGGPFSRRDLSHLDCVGIDWLNFPSRIVILRLIEA